MTSGKIIPGLNYEKKKKKIPSEQGRIKLPFTFLRQKFLKIYNMNIDVFLFFFFSPKTSIHQKIVYEMSEKNKGENGNVVWNCHLSSLS